MKYLLCGNDVGRTIINETTTLKINEDGSITDSKLSAVLKKSSQKITDEKGIISLQLKNALNEKALQ